MYSGLSILIHSGPQKATYLDPTILATLEICLCGGLVLCSKLSSKDSTRISFMKSALHYRGNLLRVFSPLSITTSSTKHWWEIPVRYKCQEKLFLLWEPGVFPPHEQWGSWYLLCFLLQFGCQKAQRKEMGYLVMERVLWITYLHSNLLFDLDLPSFQPVI